MTEVGVHEAKTHLSRLLRRVAQGEEIVITSSGRPTAMLVPIRGAAPRRFGMDEGILDVPDDFDAPLPDDLLRSFQR
jgi:prevent-host-death family protein